MRWLLAINLVFFAWACGSETSPEDSTADAGASPDSTEEESQAGPAFEADPEPSDASLFIDVDFSDPTAPVATVWAAWLGPVFGVAFRIELDGAVIATHDPVSEPFLGADAAGEAVYLAVLSRDGGADAVSFGAVRRGPAAGEVDIDEPVAVATVPLTVVAAGISRIDLRAVQVRRADGSFTPVRVAGGRLTTGGAP